MILILHVSPAAIVIGETAENPVVAASATPKEIIGLPRNVPRLRLPARSALDLIHVDEKSPLLRRGPFRVEGWRSRS